MEILKLLKLNRNFLFYNIVIFLVFFIFLNGFEFIQKYILITIFIIIILIFFNQNKVNIVNKEFDKLKKNMPKFENNKEKKKFIKSLDKNYFFKNFLLNINYLKKYNKYTIYRIQNNVIKFSKIEKKSVHSFNLKYNIEKLKSLKNIILNDLNSIYFTIPSIESVSDNTLYLEPLSDKLTYCLNLFNDYSDEIINSKIKINNKNFYENTSNNKEFIEELNLPQPVNNF